MGHTPILCQASFGWLCLYYRAGHGKNGLDNYVVDKNMGEVIWYMRKSVCPEEEVMSLRA